MHGQTQLVRFTATAVVDPHADALSKIGIVRLKRRFAWIKTGEAMNRQTDRESKIKTAVHVSPCY